MTVFYICMSASVYFERVHNGNFALAFVLIAYAIAGAIDRINICCTIERKHGKFRLKLKPKK